MAVVTTHKVGEVLVVVSDSPPVNALGAAVRSGLDAAVREALADGGVEAVVIRCDGRTFFAGADITEFGKPPQGPGLGEIIDAIEASPKPVVAAIHGTALGGGLEVALACHFRVAVPSAKLGLPEVKLGLLPGAGGTQRLPRVVGVAEALPIIVGGDPISASRAQEIGLVDQVVGEESLEADAVAFARSKIGAPPPRTRDRADRIEADRRDPGVFDRFGEDNARRMRGFEAPLACIQAVRAAVELPFDEGLKRERDLFTQLVQGGQSKALRHTFFAERQAAKIVGAPADTPLIAIRRVGVLGAGTMGGGIAMTFLSAGVPVVQVEREQAALDRGVATMRKTYEATARRGRLTPEGVDKAMGLLTPTLDFTAFADCDLVIEAVFENMDLKKEVFRRLDETVKPGAILASNTSYLDVDEIASATRRPEAVIGLHFFSPANVMRLLEVVRGAKTSDSVLATSMALARRIGKVAVVSGVCPGFIGNRMLSKRQQQAQALILEGATPWDVDRVLTEFGFPMGPFQMSDLAGLDIGWNTETSRGETLRDVLCESGRRGQKTGAGYYDYASDRTRTPSPQVEEIIAEFAKRSGKPQRRLGDDEIRERLLYPMVNEGALILEEHVAQRSGDIDVVWMNGYGWPAWTGGPMFWADQIGLKTVVDGLDRHADKLGDAFKPSARLRERAQAGQGFEG